jgi:hypothetical protein
MSEDTIRIHAKNINRIFKIENGKWKTKFIYGSDFHVIHLENSNEFELEISQNKKRFYLTIDNFIITGYQISNEGGQLLLKVLLKSIDIKNLVLILFYKVDSLTERLLKWIEIKNLTNNRIDLTKITIESLNFYSNSIFLTRDKSVIVSGFVWNIPDLKSFSHHDGKSLRVGYYVNKTIQKNESYRSKLVSIEVFTQ